MEPVAHLFICFGAAPEAIPASFDAWERARAQSMQAPGRQRDFIRAHALRRRALSLAFGGEDADWRFAETGHLRPRLLNDPAIRVSHAHARGRAAVIVARGVEIGVDVEAISNRFDAGLLPVIATPRERAALAGLDETGLARRLCALWTRKEAVSKALGLGLTLGFERLAVGDDLAPRFDSPVHEGDWTLAEWAGPDHWLCAAMRGKGRIEPPRAVDLAGLRQGSRPRA